MTTARVLVIGTPRSGTTWIGQTLGRTNRAVYVHEPDGFNNAYALRAKLGRGLQIELSPGDSAPQYEILWRAAFAGGRIDQSARARMAKRLLDSSRLRDRAAAARGDHVTPRLRLATALATPLRPTPDVPVVAKSVHACLAAEWIASEFQPRMVVVTRHPLNVLASWKTLGHGGDASTLARLGDLALRRWDLRLPIEGADRFARRVMSFGVLAGALSEAASRNPDWRVVHHEEVCRDPESSLARLSDDLGLEFADDAAAYLRESNQTGSRYSTKRTADSLGDKWRQTLTDAEINQALEILRLFPTDLGILDRVHADPA